MAVQGATRQRAVQGSEGGAVKIDGLLESQHVCLRLVHVVRLQLITTKRFGSVAWL